MTDKKTNKSTIKSLYIVIKPCFLGAEKTEITLNPRQAFNLIAGGFIVAGKKNDKDKK